MEKDFGNYEYLVKYNDNVESGINTGQQVIIVQENGDLIHVNKPAEYVAQGENSKVFESVACPMYDVNQQPVYFQLNNSSELIPLSVNSIPTVEQSAVYENPYLLPNMAVGMIDPQNEIPNKQNEISFAPNLREPSESMNVDPDKLLGGYAEITLNDEQYEILKQKGWILLEIKDKVFLLDSSGLHEITNDRELIAKLRYETSQIIDKICQPSGCSMKIEMIPGNQNPNMMLKPKFSDRIEPMQIISGVGTVQGDQVTPASMIMTIPSIHYKVEQGNDTVQTKMNPNKISLKTQYLLKDIPKEMLLGKTVNGKNLIARVSKAKGQFKNTTKITKDMKSEVGNDRNISDKHFAKLVQRVLLGTAGKYRVEEITSIESFVTQMFQVPDLRPNLYKHLLIVTKTVRKENKKGLIEYQSEPKLITGRFLVNGNECNFVHIPDMLQRHMKKSELAKYGQNYKKEIGKPEIIAEDTFLHVNITETKNVNNVSRISVTVNKRYLSLSQLYNMRTKNINAVYACTACAKIFKTREELEAHHKAKLLKIKESREQLQKQSKEIEQPEVFKCKLCQEAFVHSSSLTKHILAKHIKQ